MLEHNYFLSGKLNLITFETVFNSFIIIFIFVVFNLKIKKEILHSENNIDETGEEEKNYGNYCFIITVIITFYWQITMN